METLQVRTQMEQPIRLHDKRIIISGCHLPALAGGGIFVTSFTEIRRRSMIFPFEDGIKIRDRRKSDAVADTDDGIIGISQLKCGMLQTDVV